MEESVGPDLSRPEAIYRPQGRGSTLSDLMAERKPLPFPAVVGYLDQLSEAIDLAHDQGFIYRNLNPSTILVTAKGQLVLPDLRSGGDRKDSRSRSYRREARWAAYEDSRLITLAYMAPEQVLERNLLTPEVRNLSGVAGIARTVDGRADLYSLGVVLYQMVTGVLPFQAETPEQMALQHLRVPPPSPGYLRPDLPAAAEQALLRALAKRPSNRYVRAQDLATAFRVALVAAGIKLDAHQDRTSGGTQAFTQRGLFDPVWQTGIVPEISPATHAYPVGADLSRPSPIYRPATPEPPAPSETPPTSTDVQPTLMPSDYDPISPLPATNTTGTLAIPNPESGNTGTLRLTGPAKIIQVPVAGQPGMYVTGLLPVFPPVSSPTEAGGQTNATKGGRSRRLNMLILAVVVMFVMAASGLFWFLLTHTAQTSKHNVATGTPNLKATASAQASASANANLILADPLNQNIHNWPIATSGSMIYVFKDDAYHITDNNDKQGAPAILPDEILQGSFAYTLTMQEITGDDTSINNEFGMIIRANSQNNNGRLITTFYSFEVLNTKNGEYQFWKYDNSAGSNMSPWTKLWSHPFGKEFHQGHGIGSVNTFKIIVNGKSFTLIVNGKQITTVQDSACKGCPCTCSGGIGMLVNLKGTEVAFSDLQLTYK